MKKCPECDSERIIKDARAIDTGESYMNFRFQVAVDADPDALLFKSTVYSETKVEICADCGYIRFYAVSSRNLWSIYQTRQKDVS